jgi:hypothetical protein
LRSSLLAAPIALAPVQRTFAAGKPIRLDWIGIYRSGPLGRYVAVRQ